MDRIVKVRRSFMNEFRAFCNRFAQMCDGCCRGTCDCRLSDEIRLAKALIIRIDALRDAEEERYYVEHPFEDVVDKVEIAIRQAGRPVRSSDIRIPGEYRQRKARAISTLLKRGRIEMTIENGSHIYAVCKDGKDKDNKQRNTPYGIRH